jgi:hypothetical protein
MHIMLWLIRILPIILFHVTLAKASFPYYQETFRTVLEGNITLESGEHFSWEYNAPFYLSYSFITADDDEKINVFLMSNQQYYVWINSGKSTVSDPPEFIAEGSRLNTNIAELTGLAVDTLGAHRLVLRNPNNSNKTSITASFHVKFSNTAATQFAAWALALILLGSIFCCGCFFGSIMYCLFKEEEVEYRPLIRETTPLTR